MDEACAAAVPTALTARAQWVVRRKTMRGGKLIEAAFRADGGGPARADDPATWAPFAAALAACRCGEGVGVGYVVTRKDPYAGLTLNDCRDPATGEIAAWARGVLARLDTYCEVSPSGTGIRAWVRAPRPAPGRMRGIAVCRPGRWCAVTGRRLPGFPATVSSRQATFESLYEHIYEHIFVNDLEPLRPAGGGGEVFPHGVKRDGGVGDAALPAARILAWVARTGRAEFSRREAQRRLTMTAAEAEAALTLLAAQGRLCALPAGRARTGRPASPAFTVRRADDGGERR